MTAVTTQITPAEMERFEEALGELVRRSRIGVSTVIRKVAFDLMRDIMRATPVYTGQARGGWMAAFDYLGGRKPGAGGTPEGVAEGRSLSTAAAFLPPNSDGALRPAANDRPFFEVTNAVKHIIPLEFGRSRQAPEGMVRTTLRRHALHLIRELRGLK